MYVYIVYAIRHHDNSRYYAGITFTRKRAEKLHKSFEKELELALERFSIKVEKRAARGIIRL